MKKLIMLGAAWLLYSGLVAQDIPDLDQLICKESEAFESSTALALLDNPLTADFDLKYYRFDWYIDPAKYFIEGSATVYFQTLADNFTQVHFDFSTAHTISSVMYHGDALDFTQTGDYLLTITLPGALDAMTLDSLTISYSGEPPSNGFGSFNQSMHDTVPILWTLSEPFGAQDWWPCKNGLTDKIDSIDVYITTPQEYRGASNGKLVSETTSGDNTVYHWKHRHPIAPYLVAIAVTNYAAYNDTVHLSNGTDMPMVNYVYPENLAEAQAGTAALVEVLQFYDSLFVTYPFYDEKYGHAQFGWGGGMEHQTMSFVIYFEWGLLAHELAHQWFGDMVTCGSWEDIWLNEGFATYLEALARERFLPPASWNNWKSGNLSNITSQPGGSVKVSDTTSVNRIFSGRLSYHKGAYLLHMLRWKLGDQVFFQGLRNYLADMQFKYARTRDLKSHLEAVSGLDLTEFFNDWFTGQGYPSYDVTWDQHGNELLVELSQTTSDSSVDFFEMPVPLRLVGDGVDTMIRLDNTWNGQQFTVPVSFDVTSVEFDPDLWLISANNMVHEGVLSGTHDLSDNGGVVVYPNPARNTLQVKFLDATVGHPGSWMVVNLLGQVMKSGILHADEDFSLDITAVPAGTYALVVYNSSLDKPALINFVKE